MRERLIRGVSAVLGAVIGGVALILLLRGLYLATGLLAPGWAALLLLFLAMALGSGFVKGAVTRRRRMSGHLTREEHTLNVMMAMTDFFPAPDQPEPPYIGRKPPYAPR